jgi:membrane dipeptidase
METKYHWSRRNFLMSLAAASAGTAITCSPLLSWALEDLDPRVAKIVADTIGIDTHNHIDVPLLTAELPGPDIDLGSALQKSGLSAICMTFAVDYQKLNVPGLAYERFLNGLTAMDKQLQNSKLKRSYNLTDLSLAHKKRQPTVIQAVEGAHFLEGQIDRLQIAYNRGLRLLTLLHDSDASVPLGDVFTNPQRWGGLTTFGAAVIKECNRLGVLVDLSHANEETVKAALQVASKPVLVSHTGLNTQLGQNQSLAKMMQPRLISKAQAKFVADSGSVIGVWTHLADTPLAYAENIRAMVEVVGIDHVCIGTDTKLTPAYRNPSEARQPSRNSAPTGSNQNWAGQKFGFYYTVVDAMLKLGFTADEIGKIGGGNFCRVFNAATLGHH